MPRDDVSLQPVWNHMEPLSVLNNYFGSQRDISD